jgi:hypothetical protein
VKELVSVEIVCNGGVKTVQHEGDKSILVHENLITTTHSGEEIIHYSKKITQQVQTP